MARPTAAMIRAQARIRDLEDVLRACRDHMKIVSRWPCWECGRGGPSEPLRMNHVRREDTHEYETGCHTCNNDRLVSRIDAVLGLNPGAEKRKGRPGNPHLPGRIDA